MCAHPKITVVQKPKNIYDSFTLVCLSKILSSKNSENLIKKLLQTPPVEFILQKADIDVSQITFPPVDKEELSQRAFQLVGEIHGSLVTTADMFVAFLLATENQTKLLFGKNLKKEDLQNILLWSRNRLPAEENPPAAKVHFWGEGIGEEWVYGWTIETQKYMTDMTALSLQSQQRFIDRNKEYEQVLAALHKNGSVLLVGQPGAGKDALIESIAFDSFSGTLPGNLSHLRFFQLLLDNLLAGVDTQGMFEQRLDEIISEIAHSGNVIVYIPNFENVLGQASFHTDISGLLVPYLQRGVLRVVATVTQGAYEEFVKQKAALLDVLDVVSLEEADENKTLQILYQKSTEIEKKYSVFLSYKALVAAITYGKKYITDRVSPGDAVTLLEQAANTAQLSGKKIVEEDDVTQELEKKAHVNVGSPKQPEKDLLLDLENKLHTRLVDQQEAVVAISEAMRRLRAGLENQNKPISFLFLGPTGVGKTETAKSLAYFYFGSDESMIRLDMSEYGSVESSARLLGDGKTGGILTQQIAKNPFSLVLLDEFEKAHPDVLNLFLQILDDGRLTDGAGKTVSFVDSIIIATSNAGSEQIREAVEKNIVLDASFKKSLLDFLQQQALFKPELLNRFDDIVVFKPLGQQEAEQITQLFLKKLATKLSEQDITVVFDQSLIAKICAEGFDREFGARPLNRYIQDNVENVIAQKILQNEIRRGAKITVGVDASGKIVITF